jgi:nucleolin
LTSRSTSFLSKPRSFATATPSAPRLSPRSASIAFQRRWASGEAEAKQSDEEEPRVTAEEPTAQEQVEDTIHADNAAELSRSDAAIDEAAASSAIEPTYQSGDGIQTDTAPSVSTPGDESTSKINAAAESVRETVSDAAGSIGEMARQAAGMRSERTAPRARSDFIERSSNGALVEPKSTIYVGNLFFDVTENDLVKELSRFGTITKCRLIRDSRGLSKG